MIKALVYDLVEIKFSLELKKVFLIGCQAKMREGL